MWNCCITLCAIYCVFCLLHRDQNEDDLVDYYQKKYSDAANREHAGEEVESDEIRQKALMPTQK